MGGGGGVQGPPPREGEGYDRAEDRDVPVGQDLPENREEEPAWRGPQGGQGDHDVVLDVPQLEVDKLRLEVDELRARVDVHAEISDLVQLGVGADVKTGRVELDLEGVHARALLTVRLDQVAHIVTRALDALENRPELLTRTARQAGEAAEDTASEGREAAEAAGQGRGDRGGFIRRIGRGVGGAASWVASGARSVVRTFKRRVSGPAGAEALSGPGDEAAGDDRRTLIRHPGQELREVGSRTDLAVVQDVWRDGQRVRRITDAGGEVLEVTYDAQGEVVGVRGG